MVESRRKRQPVEPRNGARGGRRTQKSDEVLSADGGAKKETALVEDGPEEKTEPRRKKRASPLSDAAHLPAQSGAVLPAQEPVPGNDPLSISRQQASEIEQRAEALRNQIGQAREDLLETERSLIQARQEYQDLHERHQQQSEAAHADLARLEATLQEAIGRVQSGRDDSKQLQEQAVLALQTFEQAEQALQRATRDSRVVKGEFQQAEERLQQVRQETNRVHQELDAARQASEEAASNLASLRVELANLHRATNKTRQEIDTADAASQQVREHTRILRQECAALGEELQRLRREVEEQRHAVLAMTPAAKPDILEVIPAPDIPSVPSTETLAVDSDPMPEDARKRLLRYLNDALSVETQLVDALNTMAETTLDADHRLLLEEHRRVTNQQREDLQARLKALGVDSSGSQGFLPQMMSRIWDVLQRPRDGFDRTLQDLMKGLGIEYFEVAMYETLEAYAAALGDVETAQLAAKHLRQEEEMAVRLRPFLRPIAARAAEAPEPE